VYDRLSLRRKLTGFPKDVAMPNRSPLLTVRAAPRYLVAVLVCLLAAVFQYALQPILGGRFPLAAFTPAVIVAAWYGNFGPGVLATILSAVLADFFFLAPPGLGIAGREDLIGLLLFLLGGILVATTVRDLRLGLYEEHGIRIDTERRLRRTRQIQDLTTALSKARTPKEVIEACLPELLHAFGASAGAVIVAADRDAEFEVAHAIGYHETDGATSYRAALSAGTLITEAIRRHELMARERRVDKDLGSPLVDGFLRSNEAAVILPLLTGGRAIGAVALSFSRSHTFAEHEREFLLDSGRRTAQALERARLYEMAERARVEAEDFRVRADVELRERQRMEGELRRSEGRYRALAARTNRLYSLSARLSEAVTVDAVARATVEQGKPVVGASAGSVALFHDGEFEIAFGDQQGAEPSSRFPAESGLCATAAIETRRPVFVGSFAEWQSEYPQSASMVADGGYASSATMPLLVDAEAIGVLTFYFTAPVNFDDEYQPLLVSVATHCSQALDRARLYETAQRARADAETANQSKDDFLSTVSHELRTPLGAILGWASMLRDGSLDEKRGQRAVEAILNNATRQAQLVDELLDVSRIVGGRTVLDLQALDLSDTVRGAVESVMPLAERRGVELQVNELPARRVTADPRRIEQVFLNLLANAVKFTPSGGRVIVQGEEADGFATVRVTDTGRGIEPEFLPHVFERFSQASSPSTRPVGGLGLGLFIARHLVEAHNGKISVSSEGQDKGATFIVSLPVADAGAAPPVEVGADRLAPGAEARPVYHR
jgi:K+-sensing histidine kinase KdpD